MKNQRVIYFRVGLFVVIAVSIFIMIVMFLTGDQSIFEKSYTVNTSFKNAAGLIRGAAVRLSGVRIGAVTDIDFAKQPQGEKVIQVSMKISKEGMQRLNPDSEATIRTEGLLGDKYIEIMPGKEKPLTDPPDVVQIQSETPFELTSILGQSGDLLANVISISKNLDRIVKGFGEEENISNISKTIASVKASSEAIQKNLQAIESGDGILNTMIYGPKDAKGKALEENTLVRLNKAVAKLDKLMNEINNGDGTLHELIYNDKLSEDIDNTFANISDASSKLNGEDGVVTELQATMINFRQISDMLRGGDGTLGALLIDPSIYDSLKGILGEAERSKFVRAAVRYLVDQEKENQADGNTSATN